MDVRIKNRTWCFVSHFLNQFLTSQVLDLITELTTLKITWNFQIICLCCTNSVYGLWNYLVYLINDIFQSWEVTFGYNFLCYFNILCLWNRFHIRTKIFVSKISYLLFTILLIGGINFPCDVWTVNFLCNHFAKYLRQFENWFNKQKLFFYCKTKYIFYLFFFNKISLVVYLLCLPYR